MSDLYVALVHYPVYDKHGAIVTSSITTIDVHDIARSCRTYGVRTFYVVTPVDALRGLAGKILQHWKTGHGSTYNPNRSEALGIVSLRRSVDEVLIDVEAASGELPVVVATSAQAGAESTDFTALKTKMAAATHPYLLLLGTGWGLAEEILAAADHRLAPVIGPTDFNHLSVRAAAAVILDRLRGTR